MKPCKHPNSGKKKAAYGSVRKKMWCGGCDAELVNPVPSKKRARREGKKEAKCNK